LWDPDVVDGTIEEKKYWWWTPPPGGKFGLYWVDNIEGNFWQNSAMPVSKLRIETTAQRADFCYPHLRGPRE